jgi:hypothetical protein
MARRHAPSLLIAMLVLTGTFARASDASEWPRGSSRGYREVTLPAGTVLPLRLETPVSSDASRVEDRVRATLRRPIVLQGMTVLDAGTPLSGFVTEATRPGRVKGRGRIGFRFTALSHEGERYRLSTSRVVREAPGTKKRDAATIAIPAGAGALIGGLTKGKKGAAIGGAAGGAAGTGVVLATRGKDVRLGSGALVAVRLLEPLTLRVE